MSKYSVEDIVVTIPVYKETLSKFEEISLRQVCKILKAYSITIVCPSGLNVDEYKKIIGECSIEAKFEFFDEQFFDGIEGYNKLMLSTEFYGRFTDYKYLLVYQLDCYVFNDELLLWANKGYDYIGAPWIFNDYRTWSFSQKIRYSAKRIIARYTNAPNNITTTYYKVGNGGFSLRKVESSLRILDKYRDSQRLKKYMQEDVAVLNEDVFWSREVNRYLPILKIPNYKEGLKFAFDVNPELCYDLNGKNLPFGCHAWQRYNIGFWSDFIDIS